MDIGSYQVWFHFCGVFSTASSGQPQYWCQDVLYIFTTAVSRILHFII
jgi:hypothetical protein